MNFHNNTPILFTPAKSTLNSQVLSIKALAKNKLIIGSLTVTALTFSVFMFFALKIIVTDELFTVNNPLSDIRSIVFKLDQEDFISKLSENEKYMLASQVNFVSNVIGRSNRKVNNEELALSIVSESVRAKVDPLLIAAVVKSESSFRIEAISHKGARGLMQLMPDTAKFTEQRLKQFHAALHLPKSNIHAKEYNLSLGIAYLKFLEKEFEGNREFALIAYNWGPGNLKKAIRNRSHIPAETKVYAKKIISNHKKWNDELNSLSIMADKNLNIISKKLA